MECSYFLLSMVILEITIDLQMILSKAFYFSGRKINVNIKLRKCFE